MPTKNASSERRSAEFAFVLSEDIYLFERLSEIYTGQEQELLKKIDAIISPQVTAIVDVFYAEMLLNPNTSPFLDNQIVKERLHASLSTWLSDLFKQKDINGVKNFLMRLFHIGQVHARIDIPTILIHEGLFILKREITSRIEASGMDLRKLSGSLNIIHHLLDFSAVLMNESYFHDLLINERNAQSLMLNVSTQNVPVECEKLRSILFDWVKKVIIALYNCDQDEISKLIPVEHSEFGLWILYKADLLFSDKPETLQSLNKYLADIGKVVQQAAVECFAESSDLTPLIKQLDGYVSHAAWLLSSFVEHSLEMESGRDPLTKLFNRRFIPSIMQKFIKISIKHKIPFALLLFDIDHFKHINDSHGHDAGDSILSQISEILMQNIRSGDFIFRYGGEEFLMILSGSNRDGALKAAEKIRKSIESHSFVINQEQELNVTTSVGVAFHEGHPDYSRLIAAADLALYEAKNSGRNRAVQAGKAR